MGQKGTTKGHIEEFALECVWKMILRTVIFNYFSKITGECNFTVANDYSNSVMCISSKPVGRQVTWQGW